MKRMKFVSCVAGMILASVIARADDATISGKVAFEGDAPKAKKLKMDADPQCASMHADKPGDKRRSRGERQRHVEERVCLRQEWRDRHV